MHTPAHLSTLTHMGAPTQAAERAAEALEARQAASERLHARLALASEDLAIRAGGLQVSHA